jgi:hypothetical protein
MPEWAMAFFKTLFALWATQFIYFSIKNTACGQVYPSTSEGIRLRKAVKGISLFTLGGSSQLLLNL